MRNINNISIKDKKKYVKLCVKNNIKFEDFKAAYELGLSIENMIMLNKSSLLIKRLSFIM